MHPSPRQNVAEIKRLIRISDVIKQSVALKANGREYVGLCPFHKDTSPSFTVNDDKGFFKCFACQAYGDVFDYLRIAHSMSIFDAKDYLSGTSTPSKMTAVTQQAIIPQKDVWVQLPIAESKPESLNHPRYGKPVMFWVYRTLEGKVIGYVCRWNLRKGKQVLPFCQCTNTETGEIAWRWKSFAKPRPLYGMERLTKIHAPVIITEGEKSAEAARVLYPFVISITWPGGSNAVKYANWNPLANRSVILFPDNDDAGFKAMKEVEAILVDIGCEVVFVEIPEGKPKGWDAWDQLQEMRP